MAERNPMTLDGFNKLKKKLKHLEDEVRTAVEKRLGEAREMGDLSENSEFESAREELWRVDKQISDLRRQLTCADIIDSSNKEKPVEISFGCKVKLKNRDTGDILEYTLVGEGEADPSEGSIAVTTPVGQGLIRHKVGDKVEIKVPAGILKYEILQID